jgi:hypothetical protein
MKRALAVGAVVALALAIACQIPDRHFQVRDAGSADAAIDARPDAMIDADLGPCDLTAPWGTPVAIPELAQKLSVARFSRDELTAYFATGSDLTPVGSDYLYVAQRSAIGSAFGTPVPLTSLNGSGAATTPSISPDGQTLFYTFGTNAARDIYRATLITAPDQFGSGSNTPFSGSAVVDDFAYVASDGSVWFSSGSANMLQITEARSVGGGAFQTPVQETELNSPGQTNLYPMVTWDRLGIYFSRNGVIYYASRTSVAPFTFSVPQPVPELEAGSGYCVTRYCRPAFISEDGCRLYIGIAPSNTPIDMYVSSKPANP